MKKKNSRKKWLLLKINPLYIKKAYYEFFNPVMFLLYYILDEILFLIIFEFFNL